jgi:hypothetical protein
VTNSTVVSLKKPFPCSSAGTLIENYTDIVFELDELTVQGLRNSA